MLIHYKIGSFLATQQRLSFQKHRNRREAERGKNVRHYEDRTRTREKKNRHIQNMHVFPMCKLIKCSSFWVCRSDCRPFFFSLFVSILFRWNQRNGKNGLTLERRKKKRSHTFYMFGIADGQEKYTKINSFFSLHFKNVLKHFSMLRESESPFSVC